MTAGKWLTKSWLSTFVGNDLAAVFSRLVTDNGHGDLTDWFNNDIDLLIPCSRTQHAGVLTPDCRLVFRDHSFTDFETEQVLHMLTDVPVCSCLAVYGVVSLFGRESVFTIRDRLKAWGANNEVVSAWLSFMTFREWVLNSDPIPVFENLILFTSTWTTPDRWEPYAEHKVSPVHAKSFLTLDVDVEYAFPWIDACMYTSAAALAASKRRDPAGVNFSEWADYGVTDKKSVLTWYARTGCTPQVARVLIDGGGESSKIGKFIENGGDLTVLVDWVESGFTVGNAMQWLNATVDKKTAVECVDLNISLPLFMQYSTMNTNFSEMVKVSNLRKWLDLGVPEKLAAIFASCDCDSSGLEQWGSFPEYLSYRSFFEDDVHLFCNLTQKMSKENFDSFYHHPFVRVPPSYSYKGGILSINFGVLS